MLRWYSRLFVSFPLCFVWWLASERMTLSESKGARVGCMLHALHVTNTVSK